MSASDKQRNSAHRGTRTARSEQPAHSSEQALCEPGSVSTRTHSKRSVVASILRGSLMACVILGIGFLAAMAGIRIVNPQRMTYAIGLLGLIPFVFLLTPLVLGYGLIRRSKTFSIIGAFFVVLFGYWASADIRFGPGQGEKPADAIRITTANLLQSNPDPALSFVEIVATEPDVILLQEFTPELWAQIEPLPEASAYQYQRLSLRGNPDGTGILSRLPLLDDGIYTLGETPISWVDLELDGSPVKIINVHLSAPVNAGLTIRGERQYAELSRLLGTISIPVILAGDFNATAQHQRFQQFVDIGLGDAHQQAGRWLGATWGLRPPERLPDTLRIDHILMTQELEAVHSWTRPTTGSDHKMLVADIHFVADDDTTGSP